MWQTAMMTSPSLAVRPSFRPVTSLAAGAAFFFGSSSAMFSWIWSDATRPRLLGISAQFTHEKEASAATQMASTAAPVDVSEIRKEGWILKESAVLRQFRKRWGVLTPHHLYSFKRERVYLDPTEVSWPEPTQSLRGSM